MCDAEDTGAKWQHKRNGQCAADDEAAFDEASEEKPLFLQYSVLPAWLVPAPFGNPLIMLVLALGLAGVAYPIAQAWLKATSYYDAPAVRSYVTPTSVFPNFTLVLCPAATSFSDINAMQTAQNLAVHVLGFMSEGTPAPPSNSWNQGGSGSAPYNFSMYTLPGVNASSCTTRDSMSAQISGMAIMSSSTFSGGNNPSASPGNNPSAPPYPPGSSPGSHFSAPPYPPGAGGPIPQFAPPAPGSGPHTFPPAPANAQNGQAPPMPANIPHAPPMPSNLGRRLLTLPQLIPQPPPPPVWFNGTSGAGEQATCGNVEFAPLTAQLVGATGKYGKEKIIKYMTFNIQACGGPEIVVSDASGTVVASINGAAFDNPTVHSPCNAATLAGFDTVVHLDLSTPVPLNEDTAHIGSSTDDYEWTSGYSIRVGCYRNNKCQVSGSVTLTTQVRPFSYETIFSGMQPSSPYVHIARPAARDILFGTNINSSECWELTPSLPFSKVDAFARAPPNDTVSPGFSVLAGGNGAALAYGFYPAGDPNGLVDLIARGGFKYIPADSSSYFNVRLRSQVTRTLLPHRLHVDVGQVLGVQDASTGGAQPDPWPPTADDLSQFDVSLAFDASADVFMQGTAQQQCPSPTNAINHFRSCSTIAYSQLIFSPELLSYDVDVLEEFYPFDDSDAVQTLFTYLPLVAEFVLPLCAALPFICTSLARRWPAVFGRAFACLK